MKRAKGRAHKQEWDDIVADCRIRAFHKFHEHAFKDVNDPDVRFYRALKAASQPIRDPRLVMKWDRKRKRK
jgi:hypothetical protein